MITSKFRSRFNGPLPTRGAGSFPLCTQSSDPYTSMPVVSNSRLWLSRGYGVYSATDGTGGAPATSGTIGSWRAVGGSWGTDLITQVTAGLRPTLETTGVKSDGVDDVMAMPSSIAFTGAFTMYSVVSRPAAGAVGFFGRSSDSQGILVENAGAGIVYITDSAYGLGVATTDLSTLRMMRLRRKANQLCRFQEAGSSEVEQAAPSIGTLTIDQILLGGGTPSNSGSRICQLVLVAADVAAGSAEDLAIIAKLAQLEPTAASL